MKDWHTDHRFIRAFGQLLSKEGGYSDVTSDRGGRTIFGISERSHPGVWQRADRENRVPTLEEAADVAYHEYWQKVGADRLRHFDVAFELFDTAYLMGPATAVHLLQQALVSLGDNLQVDGRMGPNTRSKANGYEHPEALAKMQNVKQAVRLERIVKRDPSQLVNLPGWLRGRVEL